MRSKRRKQRTTVPIDRGINTKKREDAYGKRAQAIFEQIRSYGCCVCGAKTRIHMHHVKSRGAIGRVDKENVVPLCFECHTKGHTWGWQFFEMKLRRVISGFSLKQLAIDLWRKAREKIDSD